MRLPVLPGLPVAVLGGQKSLGGKLEVGSVPVTSKRQSARVVRLDAEQALALLAPATATRPCPLGPSAPRPLRAWARGGVGQAPRAEGAGLQMAIPPRHARGCP